MKGPHNLSDTLDEILGQLGIPAVALLVKLSRNWPEIAGPLLAGKTAPARFRNGVLTVVVQNHAWAQELSLARTDLMERIGTVLKGGQIQDIRFVVGRLPAPEEPGRPARSRKPALPPPPEPEGLGDVRDPETRAILLSIQRKALERGTETGPRQARARGRRSRETP